MLGLSSPLTRTHPSVWPFQHPAFIFTCKNITVDSISTKITIMHNECIRKHPHDSKNYFLDCKFFYHVLGTNYKCKDVTSCEVLGILYNWCLLFPPSGSHRNQTALRMTQVSGINSLMLARLFDKWQTQFYSNIGKMWNSVDIIDRKFTPPIFQ